MKKPIIAIALITLVTTTALRAADNDALDLLTKLLPACTNYFLRSVSLPVKVPEVSLKTISRIKCFAETGPARSGGIQITPTLSIGRVDFDDTERAKLGTTFVQAVSNVVSKSFKIKEDSTWLLLVVSGEGGGMIMGEGGYIDAQIFLLDTGSKSLVAYSKDPMGKGNTPDAALQDLALDISKKVFGIIAPETPSTTVAVSNVQIKPLDGSWKLSLSFPDAGITAMEFNFDLKQTGSNITGNATGSVPVRGAIDGHKVRLTETLEGVPTGIDVLYLGTAADDNTINGTVNFPKYGAGTWTARRQE